MNLSPEMLSAIMAVAGVALTLIVSAAHARGKKLPILEGILNFIQGKPKANPVDPSQPVVIDPLANRPLLRFIRDIVEDVIANRPPAKALPDEAARPSVEFDEKSGKYLVKLPDPGKAVVVPFALDLPVP